MQVATEFFQDHIADVMTMLVIDPLEIVDIEKEQAERLISPMRSCALVMEIVGEISPVLEAGEGVVYRQVAQLADGINQFEFFFLTYSAEDAEDDTKQDRMEQEEQLHRRVEQLKRVVDTA